MKVELGANWIQFANEKDNPLMLLRNKYNLTGHSSNFNDVRIR